MTTKCRKFLFQIDFITKNWQCVESKAVVYQSDGTERNDFDNNNNEKILTKYSADRLYEKLIKEIKKDTAT